MKKKKDEIPSELMHALLFKRLENSTDLGNWLKLFLNVDLADCTVSRYSTSNPLDMVWKIYEFCLKAETEELNPANMFFIAGRGSQKTLSVACLQVLLPFHFKRNFTHFGGSQDQAKRAYQYFTKFVEMPYIKDYLKDKPTQQKTIFVFNGEEVELEILSITPLSVQGRHSSAVSLDEMASLTPDKRKAYQDISGVPTYTSEGKASVKFGISSRKGRYTIVETEYENKDNSGTEFYFWTVLENTKRCPDSISGTEPFTYYVNALENSKCTQEEYNKLSEDKKSKLEEVHAFKNCYTCPLSTQCRGDLKKQTSTCRSLRPVQATIAQFRQSPSLEWWLSQAMSMQPSMEGLVFPKFKREVFEKTPAEMWQIFTGSSTFTDLTEESLIEGMCNAGVKRYLGVDHGVTAPTAFVVIYEDSIGRIFIMRAYGMTGLDPNEVVKHVQVLHAKYRFTHIYPDLAAPSVNMLIKKAKICTVSDNWVKTPTSIADGITLIRAKISPHSMNLQTMLYGLKGNCDQLITECEKYHYQEDTEGNLIEEPADDGWDHHIDAVRYCALNRWNKGKPIVSIDPAGKPKKESLEDYNKATKGKLSEWLTKEITNAIKENGDQTASSGVSKSKSGGIKWDI